MSSGATRPPVLRGRRRRVAALVAGLVLCLCPAGIAAQDEPVPLSRDDVERLVTGDTYSERETVSIVRRSCLGFRLTDADLAEFDELGAPESVLDALRSCRGRAPLEVILSVRDTSIAEADTLTLLAFARRDGRPVPDLELRLSPAEAGGDREVGAIEAVTDEQGRARFRVPSGAAAPDSTRFRVTVSGTELRSRPELRLATRPTTPAERRRALVRSVPEDGEPASRPTADRARAPDEAGGTDEPGEADEVAAADEAGRTGEADPPRRPADDAADSTPTAAGPEAGGRAGGPAETPRRDSAPSSVVDTLVRADGPRSPVVDTLAPRDDRGPPGESRRETRRRLSVALRNVPANTGSLVEMGRLLRRAGDLDGSARALRAVVEHDRSAAGAWRELGRTWARAGRAADARHALLRARELADAGTDTAGLGDDLAAVHGVAPGARIRALAGATIEGDGGGGIRWFDGRVRATPALELTGRYERSLGGGAPVLTRGPAAMDAFSLGGSLEWKEGGHRWTSTLELTRRRTPEAVEPGLDQNVYRAEQTIRVPSERGSMRFSAGGLLGRWFDRDDWVVYGRAEVPLTTTVDATSALHAGETVGTHFPAGRRLPAEEVRAHVGVDVHPGPGLRVAPRIGVGDVDSDREEMSGGLWELLVEVSVPTGERIGVEGFVHHQSPPGVDGFTVVAAGLQVAVP